VGGGGPGARRPFRWCRILGPGRASRPRLLPVPPHDGHRLSGLRPDPRGGVARPRSDCRLGGDASAPAAAAARTGGLLGAVAPPPYGGRRAVRSLGRSGGARHRRAAAGRLGLASGDRDAAGLSGDPTTEAPQPARRRRLRIAGLAVLALLVLDWSRPPERQWTAWL